MPLSHLIKSLLLALMCASLVGCSHSTHEVQVEHLLKTTHAWEGTPYYTYPAGQPEISVLKITLPPNTPLKWHTHPIPNVAYVLSGELLVETKAGKKKALKPGQVLPEVVNILHRGTSGNGPVELIVFYAGSVGTPLSK